MLTNNFPDGEIIFNASSRVDNHFGAWIEQLPSDQLKELGAALKEALKSWWQKAPQDQKDELVSMLKITNRPHNTEWTDLKAWWNQLSAKEMEETRHNFRASLTGDWVNGH
ncbi:MAG: hypothetical protein WCE81_13340 [Halobacteriota archaeon]